MRWKLLTTLIHMLLCNCQCAVCGQLYYAIQYAAWLDKPAGKLDKIQLHMIRRFIYATSPVRL
jgi:hypothetical protein